MENSYLPKKGRPSRYSKPFILHVVKTLIDEGMTYSYAATHFNIAHRTLVGKWAKRYHSEIEALKTIGPMASHSPSVQYNENCAEQTKTLQKALQQAQLKVTVLEAMIDLAESTYKISIRKNSGTKQPK